MQVNLFLRPASRLGPFFSFAILPHWIARDSPLKVDDLRSGIQAIVLHGSRKCSWAAMPRQHVRDLHGEIRFSKGMAGPLRSLVMTLALGDLHE